MISSPLIDGRTKPSLRQKFFGYVTLKGAISLGDFTRFAVSRSDVRVLATRAS
jgi:hypothetical protein